MSLCLAIRLAVALLLMSFGPGQSHAQSSNDTAADNSPAVTDTSEQLALAVLNGEALFKHNLAELSVEGIASLTRLLDDLTVYDEVFSIRVIGHTDSVGNAAYNLQLSEQRAAHVGEQIRQRFPSMMIKTLGAGESQPVASNVTEAGRERNRRVEIQVLAAGTPPAER